MREGCASQAVLLTKTALGCRPITYIPVTLAAILAKPQFGNATFGRGSGEFRN